MNKYGRINPSVVPGFDLVTIRHLPRVRIDQMQASSIRTMAETHIRSGGVFCISIAWHMGLDNPAWIERGITVTWETFEGLMPLVSVACSPRIQKIIALETRLIRCSAAFLSAYIFCSDATGCWAFAWIKRMTSVHSPYNASNSPAWGSALPETTWIDVKSRSYQDLVG